MQDNDELDILIANDNYNYMTDDDVLEHYGTKRHSGRYPWGSGDTPYQHSGDWLSRYEELKKQGLKETEIADAMDISTTRLRAAHTIAVNQRRADLVKAVKSLKGDGLSNVQIADKLGLPGESSVRSLLNADSETRMNIAKRTADNLKKIVDEKRMVDIGKGAETQLGVSPEKFNAAIEILKMEGYEVYPGRMPQVTNAGKYTLTKVLAAPGVPYKDIYEWGNIQSLDDYISYDNGETIEKAFKYPKSMDSKRLAIRYAEDGGRDKDGVVEIRRGVPDLYLGDGVNYAQVRILVDNSHYIKGMAVYGNNEDFPDGVDCIFNTNKTKDKSKLEVLKPIDKNLKKDPDNPFGSAIKERGGQSYYDDPNGDHVDPITGKRQSLSLINKRASEGDWSEWADTLPSQFLVKQPMKLINKQLDISKSERDAEFTEIKNLTNPVLKQSLLETFAQDCDTAAVNLKAAALPGQKYQVILPLTTITDKEIYAPNYQHGSKVALIRYPHGGRFEIPILTVNNNNREGIDILSRNPTDAVGINSAVAERLSGADFDGDTVMVIPLSNKVQVASKSPLKELKGFDTKLDYGPDPKQSYKDKDGNEHYLRNGKEYKLMNDTQNQMGRISNLITDMTLQGATDSELARAVKHSMVVIDAEKHHLDYKQSELDNNIDELKAKYQKKAGGGYGGASTLISRAKSKETINERKEGAFYTIDKKRKLDLIDEDNDIYVDPETAEVYNKAEVRTLYHDPVTGEKLYHDTNRKYYDFKYKDPTGKSKTKKAIAKDGKYYFKDDDGKYVEVPIDININEHRATIDSTKMAEASDARSLISVMNTPQEQAYAEYANHMKSLANQARLELDNIEYTKYSSAANKEYAEEVQTLKEQYKAAIANKPRERRAQALANSKIKAIKQENPYLDKEDIKKISNKALAEARIKTGAHRNEIYISDKEWKAIQAGAISTSMLKTLLPFCNSERVRQLATPRGTSVELSDTKVGRIKNLSANGYTTEQIANRLGVSTSTVLKYLKENDNG